MLFSAVNYVCSLDISSVTADSATIIWKTGNVDKNTAVEYFTVRLYEIVSNQRKNIMQRTLPTSQTKYTVEKLICTKTYEFEISAGNRTGTSGCETCEYLKLIFALYLHLSILKCIRSSIAQQAIK